MSPPGPNPTQAPTPGLTQVKAILAVSSCKGGVGKSTAAINLGYALARTGARVGIFDADVYGPSMPTMIVPDDTEVYQNEQGLIMPLEYAGVKLMSFGYVSQAGAESGPAIMRGPMVSQVITQLLGSTDWGVLDYLVIDYPPGTGDIQLTLSQAFPLTAALIVTTPQKLSFVDVVKGIQMFAKLKVPTLGVIENMCYFECPSCREKTYLFGKGCRHELVEKFGMKNSFEIPIDPALSRHGDEGKPFILEHPDSPIAKAFVDIAAFVDTEVKHLLNAGNQVPELSYNVGQSMVLTMPDGTEHEFSPANLRRHCRCALCIEEGSGRPLLDPASVSEDVYPTRITPAGNYAAAVEWSDGHTSSIYPFDAILEKLVSTA